ncbi:MAG: hypothetical protein KF692_01925 [Cryobacterium sp.]|nr:hypothetical protein [Cryobacterium sp.]
MDTGIDRELIHEFSQAVVAGSAPQEVVKRFIAAGAPESLADAIHSEWEIRVLELRNSAVPPALVAASAPEPWYVETGLNQRSWTALRERLRGDLDAVAVESVNRASAKVVSLLPAPGSAKFSSAGLVLGNVQSGKTTNFIAVAAKAADVGYRLIIVLSGTTDSLRMQTQERVDKFLTAGGSDWLSLTDLNNDFAADPKHAASLLLQKSRTAILVVKKQTDRLRLLRDWLKIAGPILMRNTAILIIDDEADSASIDVGENSPSTINGLIRELLDHPKTAYLAYTATPFANLLSDPSDPKGLYPRDFIVDLPAPESYFGAERVFGRHGLPDEEGGGSDGMDVVRFVGSDEEDRVRSSASAPDPLTDPGLSSAVRWFLMATSARRARSGEVEHSTMLIHTTMEISRHRATAAALDAAIADIRVLIGKRDEVLFKTMKAQWESEQPRVPASSFGRAPVGFDDMIKHIEAVANKVRVVVDNSESADRLRYDKENPATAIVVGGNTLSRGLTLNGLCSSYFVRSSNSYDTLLQMGRWFGYRDGYEDLWRVWMPEKLSEWFRDLALVEAEIRQDIREAAREGLTPDRVGVRIRLHPSMAITRGGQGRFGVLTDVSYSRAAVQTIFFPRTDAAWLRNNIEATRRLIGRLVESDSSETEFAGGRTGFRDVPASEILGFLEDYRVHRRSERMRTSMLTKYIRHELDAGVLGSWNVVVMSKPADGEGRSIGLGWVLPFSLFQRSRIRSSEDDVADLKSIASITDRVADLSIGPAAALARAGEEESTDAAYLRAKESLGMQEGLLCIYPIDANSVPGPQAGEMTRLPLSAADHVIGISMYFPQGATSDEGVAYVQARNDVGDWRDDESAIVAPEAIEEGEYR